MLAMLYFRYELLARVWCQFNKEDEPAAPIAAMTNDDVLGDAIPDDQQREMQKLCYWAVGVVSPLNLDTGLQELVTKLIYRETLKAWSSCR